LAIELTLADGCYKGVKNEQRFLELLWILFKRSYFASQFDRTNHFFAFLEAKPTNNRGRVRQICLS